MSRHTFALLAVTLVTSFSATIVRAQTNTLILPAEASNGFARAGGYNPFEEYLNFWQIFAPSQFAAASSDLILVSEMAFRLDESEQTGFHASFDALAIEMAQYTGTVPHAVTDIVGGQTAPFSTVFYATNYAVSAGPAAAPADFSIRFPLRVPFLYDRRRGPLAFRLSARGNVDPFKGFDAVTLYKIPGEPESGLDLTLERGASVGQLADGHMNGGEAILVVTQFSVLPVAAHLDRIDVSGERVILDCALTLGAAGRTLKLESAPTLSSPFSIDTNAVFTALESTNRRAMTLAPRAAAFYRITIY